jgi:PAS domain S-box-containing protein
MSASNASSSMSPPLTWTDLGGNLPTLDEILDRHPLTVTPQTLVSDAIAQIGQTDNNQCNLTPDASDLTESSPWPKRSSYVLVVEAARPVGILTERDMVQLAIAGMDLSQVPIAQVMSQPLVTLTLAPSQTIYSALARLQHHQIRHLPVVDDQGQVLGVVTHDRLCCQLQPIHLLKLRRVAEVMTEQVIHAAPTASVLSIARQMVNHRKSCVVVVEPLATYPETLIPVGIITERDMVQFQRLGLNFAATKAQAVMSTPLFCPKPSDSLWLVHQEMRRRRVRRLVVAGEQGELRGLVTQTSLLRMFDPVEMASVIAVLQQQLEHQTEVLSQTTQQLEQERGERQQIHATLQESRQQFQTIFNQTFQFIGLLRPDGSLLEANQTALDFVETSLADVVNQPFWETPWWSHDSEQQQRLQAAIAQAAAGEFVRGEFTHRSSRDTIETFDFSIKPVVSEAGQVISLVAEGRNIDDRKQIEQQLQTAYQELEQRVVDRTQELVQANLLLQESESRLQQLATNVAGMLYQYVLHADGSEEFTYVSPRCRDIYELEPEELQQDFERVRAMIHPEDVERVHQVNLNSAQRLERFDVEFRLLPPSGCLRWVRVISQPEQQVNGDVVWNGFVLDISDRKQAEQRVREQAALLDITSDAIFVRDLDHNILYWNRGAECLFGWLAAEAIDQPANVLLQEDASQLATMMQMLLERGEWRGEVRKVTKTGKQVLVEGHWTLVRDEAGQPKSILVVNTDISEKKQLEAQFLRAQRLESIGTLASGIAHDLNNILTPVLATAQLLPRKLPPVDESTQRLLEILEVNARRGGDLVNQILSFARGSDSQPASLQVGHLLAEISKIVQQTFPKSIEVHTRVATSTLWLVHADATQLHQVVMNLCVNARDAMPEGGTLTIAADNCAIDQTFARMHLDAKVGSYVKITIADTGIGIAPDVLDRIFDPFFTTKESGQGTGLGLSTVLMIVKNHGGFLDVSTQVGGGTRFNVYLPALERGKATSIETPDYLEGNDELILVVDDEVEIGQTIKATLETHHYRVLVAQEGIEALTLCVQHQAEIRVVLLDLMMPSFDGFQLIAALSKLNPEVLLIAMSGLASNETTVSDCDRLQAFLAKPFTTQDLLITIGRVLEFRGRVLRQDNPPSPEA